MIRKRRHGLKLQIKELEHLDQELEHYFQMVPKK